MKQVVGRRPWWPGWLPVAAGVIVLAGAGLWFSAPPTTPAAPSPSVVEVDIFSGRTNPTAVLAGAVAEDLYGMLADQQRLGTLEPAEPEGGTGFRGLVVRPGDPGRPVLRILPGSVYVGDAGGTTLLKDPAGGFFTMVADALPGDLMELVRQGSVEIRVSNAGRVALDSVEVTFPDNQVVGYGPLGVGEASGYHLLGLAYRYALVVATADGEEVRWQPRDFVGETPLPPGRYTYALSVTGDQIDLVFSADPAGSATPASPVPAPTATPSG